ncbi:MAG: GNAT family N-acetyltransferase [Pseudomonadota bacterium]
MAVVPVIEEQVLVPSVADLGANAPPLAFDGQPREPRSTSAHRKLAVFPSEAGFDILGDVDQIADYAVEPNIFFSPRFCISGLSRLDDRAVRLMLLHDQGPDIPAGRRVGHVRFMMPFTVEKPGFAIGPDIIRGWSNPFGPYGLPLIERRDTAQIIDDLYSTLSQPTVALPKIMVLPDLFMDSPAASILRSVALAAGLPIATVRPAPRPWLNATVDTDAFMGDMFSAHHRRNYRREWRKLEAMGTLEFGIARSAEDVRRETEEFLLMENAGWKGRERTSLAADRYRAAFAREAVNLLAARDRARVYTLKLDGRVIASLIVFVEGGRAWTWKVTHDEALSQHSPGMQLMIRATETFLDDPNIISADSCADPGHPMMSRIWSQTRPLTTLIIGLHGGLDREVRQVAKQIDLYQTTRETAKNLADKVRSILNRKR